MTVTLIRVPLLPLDSPPIYRNPCGRGFLVDFGAVPPQQFATFAAAAAEIAARMNVPPAGPLGSTRTPVIATPGVAGSDRLDDITPRVLPSRAPGPCRSPQDKGSGAPNNVAWPARAGQGVARPAKAGTSTG